jgi:Na+/H+ antiporter NhaC
VNVTRENGTCAPSRACRQSLDGAPGPAHPCGPRGGRTASCRASAFARSASPHAQEGPSIRDSAPQPEAASLDEPLVLPAPPPRRRWLAAAAIAAGALLLWFGAPGRLPAEGGHIGFWSLLPALLTLGLVFLTRDVVSSLFLGVVAGGLVSGQLDVIAGFLLPAIGSESFATILLVYLWALGGLIGLWTRTGGAQVFAQWASRGIVRGPRGARLFAWLVGILFHQGGTISTLLAGTTVRPVSDAQRVSKEELTYVIDSTASPVATVIPFNAWPFYVSGLVVGTTPLLQTQADAVAFFFRSIAYNFYGLFAVFLTLLFALGWLPWVGGKMRRAIERARTTGELNGPDSIPLTADELTRLRVPDDYPAGLLDFVLPMATLLGVAIVPWLSTGKVRVAEAFGLALLVAFALALLKGMPLRTAMNGFVDGCKGVTIGAIILGLAVTLGYVSKQLGTAAWIVETTAGAVSPAALPALLLAICMAVAFSIGSSWGTYAVVFPIAMPLAFALNPDPAYNALCFGAVLGGAVFGDQCSPISDTTILSALACGGDLMDHVTTQLPLALVAATLAGLVATAIALA